MVRIDLLGSQENLWSGLMKKTKTLSKKEKNTKKIIDIAYNIVSEGESGLEQDYLDDRVDAFGTKKQYHKAVELLYSHLNNLNNEL